ncbi:MAG: M23 family metallopeptidase [Anaerolineae bacterium]
MIAAKTKRVRSGLQVLCNSIRVPLLSLLVLALVTCGWTVPAWADEGANCIQETGAFSWPARGMITQGYWWGHQALDIGAPTGSSVLAADTGNVSFAGWTNTGYGYLVILEHDQGYVTYYAHLSQIHVAPGQAVSRGQGIGAVGSTGNSTGPHLHFEIRLDDVKQNPLVYLPDNPDDEFDQKTCPSAH